MQESFWWWQCSARYIYSFFPLPPPPYLLPPFSQSLISLMVSVNIMHHVYLLTYLLRSLAFTDGCLWLFSTNMIRLTGGGADIETGKGRRGGGGGVNEGGVMVRPSKCQDRFAFTFKMLSKPERQISLTLKPVLSSDICLRITLPLLSLSEGERKKGIWIAFPPRNKTVTKLVTE